MYAILSAACESFATVVDKVVLKKSSISSHRFVGILFVYMAAFCLPLLYFFEITQIDLESIMILACITIGSALQNYLFYVSLSKKDLSSLEPINNSEPIIVMLLAFLVFPDERNILVLILGCITTAALIFAHFGNKNGRFCINFDKYSSILILSILLSALLLIGYKYALEFVSPVTLYTIRTFGVSLFLMLIFRPRLSSLTRGNHLLIMLAAFLYSVAAVTQYFAIAQVGVSITVLVLSLSPVIIYFSSHFVLREKIHPQQIISSIVIIACVAFAIFSLSA